MLSCSTLMLNHDELPMESMQTEFKKCHESPYALAAQVSALLTGASSRECQTSTGSPMEAADSKESRSSKISERP